MDENHKKTAVITHNNSHMWSDFNIGFIHCTLLMKKCH